MRIYYKNEMGHFACIMDMLDKRIRLSVLINGVTKESFYRHRATAEEALRGIPGKWVEDK